MVLQHLQHRLEKRMESLQRVKLAGFDVVIAENGAGLSAPVDEVFVGVTRVNGKVDNVAHGQQDPPHIVSLRRHGGGYRIRRMGTHQQAVAPEAQKREEKSKEILAALEANAPVLTGQCRGCPRAEAVLDRRSGAGIYLLLLGKSSRPSARVWTYHRTGAGQCGRALLHHAIRVFQPSMGGPFD